MEDTLSKARDQAEEEPSVENNIVENNIVLKEATAKYRLAARKSWQEKTESLNLDKEGNKLWKLPQCGGLWLSGSGRRSVA